MLFISTNWQGIAVQVKATVVVALMLACYFSAFKLKGKSPLKSVLSESLIFLGCVMFGGGAILVSQHFQVTGNQPELLLWAMGIAPVVVLFRSHPAAILCAGIVAYRVIQPSGNAYSFDWLVILSTLSALYCAYCTRSQVALALSLAACAFSISLTTRNLDEFVLLFCGIGCFILHLWHEHSKRWQVMSLPYLLVSFALVLGALLMLSCEYSSQSFFEKVSVQHTQLCAIVSLAMLGCLIKSPACKTKWPLFTGVSIIAAVLLMSFCSGGENKIATGCSLFLANLFFLFYITSSIESRLIQFLPVATLTIFALIFVAAAPGGAMLGSGIAFGVGLVLMICSFAALSRSMRTVSERSLK